MRLHNLGYLLKEGGRNIFSNKLMSFACIGVLVACFLLIGSAAILSLTVNNIVDYVESQNEMVAFLDENVTVDDADVIGMELMGMDNVSQVRFESKEDALMDEKVRAGEDSHLYEGLETDNPLLDKYIVQIDNVDELEETVAQIQSLDGVYKVIAQTDVARILAGLKKAVNYAGVVVVAILIAVSLVIITNTIKLTVFTRRKEINIMKYVGATDAFIRMPFLVEGMLIGILAAVFAIVILGVGYTYLLHWAGLNHMAQIAFVLNNAVQFEEVALPFFLGFTVIGIFIGSLGSGVFVRKYLKV